MAKYGFIRKKEYNWYNSNYKLLDLFRKLGLVN